MSAVCEKSFAIVGLGAAARDWLECAAELPELAFAAGVDPDPARRAEIEARGAHGFACVNELLAVAGAPHVAILCTPPALRLELAEPLLRAGVDLLIEPPLATVPDHADRIAELAERSDRLAMTIGRFRGDLALRDAAARVAAGAVGRLAAVEVALSAKRDARADWRGDPALSGGGVWLELGGDALEIVEALAGPVHRIRMLDSVRLQGGEVEDEARIETEHAGGVVGLVRLSWNEHLARPLARCSGDRGELALGWAQSRLARENGVREVIAGPRDPSAMRVEVLRHFLAERRSRERRIDPGAQSLAWLHAAYRSFSTKRFEIA